MFYSSNGLRKSGNLCNTLLRELLRGSLKDLWAIKTRKNSLINAFERPLNKPSLRATKTHTMFVTCSIQDQKSFTC